MDADAAGRWSPATMPAGEFAAQRTRETKRSEPVAEERAAATAEARHMAAWVASVINGRGRETQDIFLCRCEVRISRSCELSMIFADGQERGSPCIVRDMNKTDSTAVRVLALAGDKTTGRRDQNFAWLRWPDSVFNRRGGDNTLFSANGKFAGIVANSARVTFIQMCLVSRWRAPFQISLHSIPRDDYFDVITETSSLTAAAGSDLGSSRGSELDDTFSRGRMISSNRFFWQNQRYRRFSVTINPVLPSTYLLIAPCAHESPHRRTNFNQPGLKKWVMRS
jgi:hypothetical protein